jgi:hypothetical protein
MMIGILNTEEVRVKRRCDLFLRKSELFSFVLPAGGGGFLGNRLATFRGQVGDAGLAALGRAPLG